LNSELCTCKIGTLLLEPHFQFKDLRIRNYLLDSAILFYFILWY
jgi:hypothetical protein